MVNKQLSTNFKLHEFLVSESYEKAHGISPIEGEELNSLQIYLAERLAKDILQPIRRHFGKLKINSGIRTPSIMEAMIAYGFKPSPTTDHSYGNTEVNWKGSGAADIVPIESDIWSVYDWIISTRFAGQINYNQVILYPGNGFIHISNPKEILFSSRLVKDLQLTSRKREAVYKDGAYSIYRIGQRRD